MKKIGYLIIIGFLIMLSACASNEESFKQEKVDTMDNSFLSEKPLETDCTAVINPEKLEIKSLEDAYTFDGKPLWADEASDFALREHFEERRAAGTLCHQDPTELTLQFSEEIPSALMWSQFFYREANEVFPAELAEGLTTVEDVGEEIVLPLGNNISLAYSDFQTQPTYRIVRIICQYESEKVEYYAIFDGWRLDGKSRD